MRASNWACKDTSASVKGFGTDLSVAVATALLASDASGTLKDCVYMGFSSLFKRV
jgi:uncharacterized protein with von Willebrand factor type A (vWA) domain